MGDCLLSSSITNNLRETAADEKTEVYFPILDRIAEGYFDSSTTDKQLYDSFLQLLRDDDLITDPESLSSLKFALAIRNSAPRIEAHYHYYNTSVIPALGGNECAAWLDLGGKQYCDPSLESQNSELKLSGQSELPFDRTFGSGREGVIATLYADITSQEFRKFHQTASKSAKDGKSLYRIRHKPSAGEKKPLLVSGYGVDLSLKRTDYIVIDDRPKGDDEGDKKDKKEKRLEESKQASLQDEEVDDLRPLSASELADLSVKASSFVVGSEDALESLLKLTQDFPKHSSSLVTQNVSTEFLEEHMNNRELFIPQGFNILFVNGVQYDPRKVDAFSLLDHLRRERKLINDFRNMGLSAAEAIRLLSHPAILAASSPDGSQRYDWRDDNEGGNVILWLNDISKDKRYQDWPEDVFSVCIIIHSPCLSYSL
jgi:UDP-glucose:glycoprotein glucosyltransferase